MSDFKDKMNMDDNGENVPEPVNTPAAETPQQTFPPHDPARPEHVQPIQPLPPLRPQYPTVPVEPVPPAQPVYPVQPVRSDYQLYTSNPQYAPQGPDNTYVQPSEAPAANNFYTQYKTPENERLYPMDKTDRELSSGGENINSILEFSTAQQKGGSGLRLFCAALALVIVASVCLSGGYMMGKSGRAVPMTETSSDTSSYGININDRPSGSVEEGYSAETVAEMVKPSVVGITIYNDDLSSGAYASGIIISEDGYILTNDHIYADIANAKFLIITSDGKEYDAEYVAGDTRSDLAVLKMNGSGFTPAVFGNSDEMRVGESSISIGCPGGMTLSMTVTKGIISGVNRRIAINSNYSMKLIQTDTAINPGSSGGALVNMYGQVIGINSSKLVSSGFEGIGFAIPSSVAQKIVDQLIKNGAVTNRARLGITYRQYSVLQARHDNTVPGLYIDSIGTDSDLYGKGFEKGDIITHINGQSVVGDGNFLDIIENCVPGDTVSLTIRKSGGSDREITVTLLTDTGTSSYVKK
jgi:serine protease Do